MSFLQALILAIVEGITEFLPVSSTGHMIIASHWLGIRETPFVKLFIVAIQLGAILSVLVLYRKRFFKSVDFYVKLFIAFIPAVVLGLLLNDIIDKLLESIWTVAIALFIGGLIFLKVDDWYAGNKETEIDNKKAFIIGLFQTIAMIPGVSRSGATIIGGMTQKLTRKTATEFSFFLAVPTMFGATAKKLWDFYQDGFTMTHGQMQLILFGNAVAFLVAMLAIKMFIAYVTKKGFRFFGWYRIAVALLVMFIALYQNR